MLKRSAAGYLTAVKLRGAKGAEYRYRALPFLSLIKSGKRGGFAFWAEEAEILARVSKGGKESISDANNGDRH